MRALLLLTLVPAVAAAQLSSLPQGSRVRGVFPVVHPKQINAIVVASSNDSLWLRNARATTSNGPFRAPRLALQHGQIEKLELHVRTDHGRGAFRGLNVGLGISGGLAILAAGSSHDTAPYFPTMLSLIVVPTTTLIGALIGVEEWRTVVPATGQR